MYMRIAPSYGVCDVHRGLQAPESPRLLHLNVLLALARQLQVRLLILGQNFVNLSLVKLWKSQEHLRKKTVSNLLHLANI